MNGIVTDCIDCGLRFRSTTLIYKTFVKQVIRSGWKEARVPLPNNPRGQSVHYCCPSCVSPVKIEDI